MKRLISLTIVMALLLIPVLGNASAEETSFGVYSDYSSEENHFNMKAKMSAAGHEDLVIPMNEEWTDNPHSGNTCIRCQVNTEKDTWGGWMFLTGILIPGDELLSFNDGSSPDQGEDLSGMNELHFWARGQNGGENVEFICFGFGIEDESIAYPDTAAKQTTKVQLTTEWQEYVINWDGLDLSNIICGFGYACAGGPAENIFYLDDIRFVG